MTFRPVPRPLGQLLAPAAPSSFLLELLSGRKGTSWPRNSPSAQKPIFP